MDLNELLHDCFTIVVQKKLNFFEGINQQGDICSQRSRLLAIGTYQRRSSHIRIFVASTGHDPLTVYLRAHAEESDSRLRRSDIIQSLASKLSAPSGGLIIKIISFILMTPKSSSLIPKSESFLKPFLAYSSYP